MIAVTIDSGDVAADLEKAKKIEITSCKRVGKFRHNHARPILVAFSMHDDKEALLSCKRKLPVGVYTNKEYPLHTKGNCDRLMPIFKLAKSLPHYHDKCRMDNDKLIIKSMAYKVDDIPNLPVDLAG